MFSNHQPLIGKSAQSSPAGLARVVQFVSLTIQQTIERVPVDLDVVTKKGVNAPCLWGMKKSNYEYMQKHSRDLYVNAMACNGDATQLVNLFGMLPGLGLVKGAFVAQMAFGVSGCLDSHNLKRFGINPNRYKAGVFKNLKQESQAARIKEYNALIDKCGGTEGLWDSWCNYVAERRSNGTTGEDISALHLAAIVQ